MQKFALLENLISVETSLINSRFTEARAIELNTGEYAILTNEGVVHFNWHKGFEMQVKQRFPNWSATKSPSLRAEALAKALIAPPTVARLQLTDKPNQFYLYGMVNPNRFQPTDKKAVRKAFYQALAQVEISTHQPIFRTNNWGVPTEAFALPNGKHTSGEICLEYGFDSGVSAFRLSLARTEVILCRNGLWLPMRNDKTLLWAHLANETVEQFLTRAVPMVFAWQEGLEVSIDLAHEEQPLLDAVEAASRSLSSSDTSDIESIIELVEEQQRVEVARWGNTRWAASQSLSFVGTHQVHGLNGWRLREAATAMLQVNPIT